MQCTKEWKTQDVITRGERVTWWEANHYRVIVPVFESSNEEFEFLIAHKLEHADQYGDSSGDSSFSDFFWDRIESLAETLGVPAPQRSSR